VRPLRPVRSPSAEGGAPDVVQTRLLLRYSRRHRCRWDGAGFWPAVCPALRVWPLNSQVAFALQLGDAFFHAAHFEEVSRDLPGPLAPRRHVSLSRPNRFLLRSGPFGGGRPAGKRDCVLVCAVATFTLWVTASAPGSKLPARATLSFPSRH